MIDIDPRIDLDMYCHLRALGYTVREVRRELGLTEDEARQLEDIPEVQKLIAQRSTKEVRNYRKVLNSMGSRAVITLYKIGFGSSDVKVRVKALQIIVENLTKLLITEQQTVAGNVGQPVINLEIPEIERRPGKRLQNIV